MAQLGEMTLPVRLTVGTVSSGVIGEIAWPVRGRELPPARPGVVELAVSVGSFDEVRSSLAGLLRATADEIESPSTDVALPPSCS